MNPLKVIFWILWNHTIFVYHNEIVKFHIKIVKSPVLHLKIKLFFWFQTGIRNILVLQFYCCWFFFNCVSILQYGKVVVKVSFPIYELSTFFSWYHRLFNEIKFNTYWSSPGDREFRYVTQRQTTYVLQSA